MWFLLLSLARAEDPSVLWQQGAEAVAASDHATAADRYRALLQDGVINGDVYYNLGNALFHQGQVAPAILAWRRAAVLNPRDPDVEANLEFARRSLRDQMEVSREAPWFAPWQSFLSAAEGQWGGAALLGLGLLGLGLRRRVPFPVDLPALGLGLVGAVIWGGGFYQEHQPVGAVILVEEVAVSSELGGGVELFRLHEGAEVLSLEQAAGQVLVALPDGRKGWVGSDRLGLADPLLPFPGQIP